MRQEFLLIGFGQLQTFLESLPADKTTNIAFKFRPLAASYKCVFGYSVDLKAVLTITTHQGSQITFVGTNVESVVNQARCTYKTDLMF